MVVALAPVDMECAAVHDNIAMARCQTRLCGRSDSLDLRSARGGYPLLPDDLILMEIKIPGVAPMWLAGLLSWQGIFPTTFSKYGAYYQKYIFPSKPDTFTKEVILSA